MKTYVIQYFIVTIKLKLSFRILKGIEKVRQYDVWTKPYQQAVRKILVRCIQQYQILRELHIITDILFKRFFYTILFRYMNIISELYSTLSPFHFLAGIPIISVACYTTLYVLKKNCKFSLIGKRIIGPTTKYTFCCILYVTSWIWCSIIRLWRRNFLHNSSIQFLFIICFGVE